MPIHHVLIDRRVPVRVWTDVDERSLAQRANIARMPFIRHHVAAMSDVHVGIGATIGSVIATHKAIIPAAVGVDIGCGMVAARLSLTANELDEKALRRVSDQISRDVPVGRAQQTASDESPLGGNHGTGLRGRGGSRGWRDPTPTEPKVLSFRIQLFRHTQRPPLIVRGIQSNLSHLDQRAKCLSPS